MSEWRTIDSVPRDAMPVLVFIPSARIEKRIQSAYFRDSIAIIGNQFGWDVGEPTYWQYLPEPPDSSEPSEASPP